MRLTIIIINNKLRINIIIYKIMVYTLSNIMINNKLILFTQIILIISNNLMI